MSKGVAYAAVLALAAVLGFSVRPAAADALYSDNQPNVANDGRIGRGGAQFAFYLGDMGDPGNIPRVNHSNPTKRPKAGTSFANVVVGPLP